MDPRQRLLLENVCHALENAGTRLDQAASSKTSVFVAGSSHDHLIFSNMDPETSGSHQATGIYDSGVANRHICRCGLLWRSGGCSSGGPKLEARRVWNVGYTAESPEPLTRQLRSSAGKVEEEDILALVEYCIDPCNSLTDKTCQFAYGLVREAKFRDWRVPVPAYMKCPLFPHPQDTNDPQGHQRTEHDNDYSPGALLSAAQTREIATAFTLNAIRKQLACLVSSSENDIDAAKSITSNGVDSIIAMELRTWLVKELGADITMTDIMTWESLTELSERVVNSSKFVRVSK
ncbi:hypothetical protein BDV30DRAFT_238598 [Aspergillus minisclerotigenes]|uniref:Carrier domain-containing protein n=1 Tax=Aspergillus minisclerotigenes TaxID=656917 RepID=A0A5N6J3D2_9EURO|nr:hypothetical protein BDV30DRAFT_238598 [Aspergillus minisclerotigenes]